MAFKLSSRSRERLQGVHPDLVRVVERAIEISPIDFVVLEGVRTVTRQKELVTKGASKTMNSRHIMAANGYGHAVDLAPLIDGNVSWDWPLYHRLAASVKQAARELGVPIEWGGDWKSFKDGPHWQLPWASYPSKSAVSGKGYTGETETQAKGKAVAAATCGVATGVPMAGEPLVNALDAVTSQQAELSSGDMLRMAIAFVIVAGAVYFAWRKL